MGFALRASAFAVGLVSILFSIAPLPRGHADAVGYLINVTVRPGYNFPDANGALAYGYGVCDRVQKGDSYPAIVSAVSADFPAPDEYQSLYLIGQAVDELCPELIWQVRRAAAH